MAIARSVVVAQGKGGVGKTSVTCNVAGLAAAAGYRVLLIDLDPQGNVARDLGMTPSDGRALVTALVSGGEPPREKDVRPGLDVVPGGPNVGDLSALALMRASRGEETLAVTLEASLVTVADDYDLVLIDTPPGERMLVEAAMGCASAVVIPTRTDEASIDGLERVAERFSHAKATNPDLALAGVLLFAIGSRSRRLERSVRDSIEKIIGTVAPVFDTRIRHMESAAVDARRQGLLVHELEGAATAAQSKRLAALRAGATPDAGLFVRDAAGLAGDYEALTRELLARLGAMEKQETPA